MFLFYNFILVTLLKTNSAKLITLSETEISLSESWHHYKTYIHVIFHLFYCYGDGLIITSQVDLTDAPVALGHDLVGEVHGVRDKDHAEDGHHDVDRDVDVRTLLNDGVHDVRALEALLLVTFCDWNIICTQLRTFLKVWVKSATNN